MAVSRDQVFHNTNVHGGKKMIFFMTVALMQHMLHMRGGGRHFEAEE